MRRRDKSNKFRIARRHRVLAVEAMERRELLATLLVNGVDDTNARDPELTLREAIEVVDGTLAVSSLSAGEQAADLGQSGRPSRPDRFRHPRRGVHTIAVTYPLPAITVPVSIDGTSQAGWKANDLATGDNAVMPIVLDGTRAGASVDGLTIAGGNSTIRGLVFSNFSGNGITLSSASNLVAGDEVGTDATGETAAGNGRGIFVTAAPDNTIGGTVASDRNLISGNQTVGLGLDGAATLRTVVEGNVIGTDARVSIALPNGQGGVQVAGGASSSTIGGTLAGAGNLIAGNGGFGVGILEGNTIGATAANMLFANRIYANSGTQIEDDATAAPTPTITAANIYPSSTQIHGNLPVTYDEHRVELFTTSTTISQPPLYLGYDYSTYDTVPGFGGIPTVVGVIFNLVPSAALTPGQMVVATSTNVLTGQATGIPSQNTSGYSAPFTLVAKPQADLSLTTSSTPGQVHPGQSFTETFTVANLGPDDASNAVLTITLPIDTKTVPSILFTPPSPNDIPSIDGVVSYNPTQGAVFTDGTYAIKSGVYSFINPKAVVSLGTIAAGSQAVFTLVLQAPGTVPDSPTPTLASVASDTYDTDTTDKSGTIATAYVDDFDLDVTSLIASSNAPILGQPLTYTAVVTNNGPDSATGVMVAVVLPSTISESSPQTLFPVGTIAPGGSQTVTVTVHPTAVGAFVVTFGTTASNATGETDPSNDYASLALTIQAPPPVYDLVATAITASSNAPIAGQPLTYSFVVTNNGPDPATGVVVAVALPSTISDSGLQTLIPLGTIAAGGSQTATITVHPTGAGAFAVTFDATASYAAGEADPSNNDATLTLTIQPAVGPKIVGIGPSSVKTRASAVCLTFNESIDPASATNLRNYQIVTAGRDRKYGTKDDKSFAIASAQISSGHAFGGPRHKEEAFARVEISVVGGRGVRHGGHADRRRGGEAHFRALGAGRAESPEAVQGPRAAGLILVPIVETASGSFGILEGSMSHETPRQEQ